MVGGSVTGPKSDSPPPQGWRAVAASLRSWRTASVVLLSFSSGLPLGLLWIALPDWMRKSGIDIRVVGLITLVQAPYSLKILWSPLLDRWEPAWLGRRRSWIAITQIGLFALTLSLAGLGSHPDAIWVLLAVALAIALVSATQDIVIDAYAVEALRPEEHGVAVGGRIAVYRAAMNVAGAIAITTAAWLSWQLVIAILATFYLPLLVVTWKSPEPEHRPPAPTTLRQAVWEPFLGLLARHRALEILAFVFFYKFADQLAQSLQRPFLIDRGYDDFDRGIALGTVGLVGTLVGTFLGGAVTVAIGLGHSLWVFGVLQILSNVGFVLLAESGTSRPLMYSAMGFEALTTGLGMGAFGVLLLRLTERRFSATQYALLSSLFSLPRLIAGPITGALVHAVGWTAFFIFTMVAGLPGLFLLARFVPLGVREPEIRVETPRPGVPHSNRSIAILAGGGGAIGLGLGLATTTLLTALQAGTNLSVAWPQAWDAVWAPTGLATWIELIGALLFGAVCALGTAAVLVARRGRTLEANAGGG
jgi:PAT family beta-lactamase induction signal transducer AmpG